MRLIRFMIEHSPRMLLLAVLTGLFGGAAGTGLLVVINRGLEQSGSTSDRLFVAFLGLAGLALITQASSALLLNHIGQDAMYRLRTQLSRQVLGVPLRSLEDVGVPRLIGVLTDDILSIMNAVSNVPMLCVNLAAILSCMTFLTWLSWRLALIVVGVMVLGLVTVRVPFMAANRHFTLGRKEHNNVLAHLRALVSGIKELKLNRKRRNAFVAEMLDASAERFRMHSTAAMRIYVLGSTWGEMLTFVTPGVLVFIVPRLMTVTDGTLVTFVVVLLYLMEPLNYILNQAAQFSKGSVALKSVEAVGLTLSAMGVESESPLAPAPASWQRIELVDMVFSYQRDDGNGRFVLGPINLACTPGELLFITGGNGSGKTTLAKVLLGLYVPEAGHLLLDGRPVTDAEREDYRQLFAAVFADFFLFGSLLGADKTGLDERAASYLRRLQLDQKVQVKAGVLSTVDELSQGQRKRLALLAAYLEDRPILLFDEWAADQDPSFKDLFYHQLLPDLKALGKTVVVISHDDRYYDVADRVVKLDEGRVVGVSGGQEQSLALPRVGAGNEPIAVGAARHALGAQPTAVAE